MKGTVEERFLDKITINPETGCWLWRALTGGGYGNFFFEGKYRRAHRFSYQAFYGQIPDGLDLDHVCEVKRCVNPTHLRMVTERENAIITAGVTAENSKKILCINGHPLEGEGALLIETLLPHRVCRHCARKAWREFARKKRRENSNLSHIN